MLPALVVAFRFLALLPNIRWGALNCALMCQPNVPVLFRAPALVRLGLFTTRYNFQAVPCDITGTMESIGTIGSCVNPTPSGG